MVLIYSFFIHLKDSLIIVVTMVISCDVTVRSRCIMPSGFGLERNSETNPSMIPTRALVTTTPDSTEPG